MRMLRTFPKIYRILLKLNHLLNRMSDSEAFLIFLVLYSFKILKCLNVCICVNTALFVVWINPDLVLRLYPCEVLIASLFVYGLNYDFVNFLMNSLPI